MSRRYRRGPDFIGIGPPKTGTTWLYDKLVQHPELWLPPNKELHWFNQMQAGGPFSLGELLFGRGPTLEHWRHYWYIQVSRQLVARAYIQPSWKLRYIVHRHSDEHYLRLFDRAGGRVAGEITPSYCDLDDDMVAHIRQLIPRAKIVITLRNPIERSWSECRRLLGRRKKRAVEDIPHEEIMDFLVTPPSLDRSNYVAIIERWHRHFSHEQLSLVFLDNVVDDPRKALIEVFEFLGVDAAERHIADSSGEPTHVGWGDSVVPPVYRQRLAELLREPIRRAADELGGPAADWLEYAEASRS